MHQSEMHQHPTLVKGNTALLSDSTSKIAMVNLVISAISISTKHVMCLAKSLEPTMRSFPPVISPPQTNTFEIQNPRQLTLGVPSYYPKCLPVRFWSCSTKRSAVVNSFQTATPTSWSELVRTWDTWVRREAIPTFSLPLKEYNTLTGNLHEPVAILEVKAFTTRFYWLLKNKRDRPSIPS